MPRVVHFEIHADDPEQAIRFYNSVFGWRFTPFENFEYWLIATGESGQPGIDGGLVRRKQPIDGASVIAFVCTVAVDDLDRYLMRVVTSGGQVVVPKSPVPGVGWLAHCKDTEGNVFGMLEADAAAA
jgi:predicted enzyme related to lactoylglutathione lyase